jgi:hypothetical protein
LLAYPIKQTNTVAAVVWSLFAPRCGRRARTFGLVGVGHPQNSFACDGQWCFANCDENERASPIPTSQRWYSLKMDDDVNDVRWREFEDLGEEDVRKRLAAHIWSEEKEKLARQWLEHRGTSLAREANDLAREANNAARQANDLASKNNIIATVALIIAVVAIAVSIIGLFLKRG